MKDKVRRSRNEALSQRKDFTEQLNAMQQNCDSVCSQNKESEAELETEKEKALQRKEYSESVAKLEAQVADQDETMKKQAGTIGQMSAENKQAETCSKKSKVNKQQLVERKMDELAQEFRKKMEDNIRLLHQRIHVAEEMNNENKDSCKRTNQRYEQENRLLGEKVANYENGLRTVKFREAPSPVVNDLNYLELATLKGLGLDFAAGKLEEQREYVLSHVSKMLCEVQCAKDWIVKRNDKMKQLKDVVDRLTVLLGEKEKEELLLREKVWELEANVSQEGGEKLNLAKAVSQLERKVGKLEKDLKEKDEELVALGEKKREAIRQLCFLIEFHGQRYCDRLNDLVTRTRPLAWHEFECSTFLQKKKKKHRFSPWPMLSSHQYKVSQFLPLALGARFVVN